MVEEKSYRDLFDDPENQKSIMNRARWIYSQLEDFIRSQNYEDMVVISEAILKHVVVDYYVDIERLKSFSGIAKVNDSKIYAYTAFWLLRHKALIPVESEKDNPELVFVNEVAVAQLLRGLLLSEPVPILKETPYCLSLLPLF